jgi:hypothetical protein
MLSDPGQTSTPDHNSASVWPPLSQARRLRQSSFLRGSITRLYGSLSTLEDAISGRQPRLAFGDWLDLAERVSNPWGLDRDFLLLIHVFVSLFLSMFQRHPRLSGLWLAPCDLNCMDIVILRIHFRMAQIDPVFSGFDIKV